MTRELNVRITIEDDEDIFSDEFYAECIRDAILTTTWQEKITVSVNTVKPESEKK